MSIAQKLQREHLAEVVPYASARRTMSGGSVWLNANESPYSNDYQLNSDNLNRYPAFQSTELNQSYAEYAGVNEQQVMSCRGSDEAIELLIRAFCEPGSDQIIVCPPTYGMYAISAQTHGAAVKQIPLRTADWQLDLEALLPALQQTKLVFLCSPSNPLGNTLASADIQQVLETAKNTLVVVDEAYIEFCPDATLATWLERYPNLVILRTLSKAFALAGARCGFALANSDIIEVLKKVLAPYPLPDLTVQVAVQALSRTGLQRLQQQVSSILEQRAQLLQQLSALPMQIVADSDTNFILLQVDNASELIDYVKQQGVLIRNQSAQVGLAECVRISVGNNTENRQLIAALNSFYGESL
ncbi:histidinol-phosphate transaminase [Idiomarina seosinensis]|uniref:Histidinol-phosphate aminotransferase n=1 Tax=Idiomarina seosinensis TaxID=281739 RepID=A0A432ZJP3_9GAMM|nr:histidinol-phosphate transaminase [Idiomarina seosinensis]RUO78040.1 histidinol-phosphate transaminase [Idiomarina seosinensis]